MVDPAAARFSRIVDFHRLFHVGGVSGKRLLLWQLHLAFLFAGTFWRFAAQLVWTKAIVVAGLAHLFPRILNSLGARRVSTHLLLLSRRVLQSVLGRSASVHRGRAAQDLLGRTFVPAHHAKCAPLFSLSGALIILILAYDVWKAFGLSIQRLAKFIRHRRRHDRARYQCVSCSAVIHSGVTRCDILIGGFRDQLAKSPTRYRAYACVSCLNRRHMLWAWLSLFWVGFSDLYVRLCAMGVWHDLRIV